MRFHDIHIFTIGICTFSGEWTVIQLTLGDKGGNTCICDVRHEN